MNKSFPGKLQRVSKNRGYVLTEEQVDWMRKYGAKMILSQLTKELGVCKETVVSLFRRYGIKRNYKAIHKIQAKHAARTMIKRNTHKGRKPDESCIKASRERWRRVKAGELPAPVTTFKKRHPKKAARVFKERGERLSELYRKEKRRIVYGIDRHSNLKIVMKPYTQSQTHRRLNALKRGYIVYQDCSDQGGERYNIYYDKDTIRAPKFEANCIADGFQIKPFEETESDEQQESEL